MDESGERVFEEVQVQLEIGEADYSNVEAVAGEGLEPLRAIFVPAASVNSVSVQSYVNLMGSYNANALVLEVKPTSGQLTWASSSETAEASPSTALRTWPAWCSRSRSRTSTWWPR